MSWFPSSEKVNVAAAAASSTSWIVLINILDVTPVFSAEQLLGGDTRSSSSPPYKLSSVFTAV